jgi:hypothetical protein
VLAHPTIIVLEFVRRVLVYEDVDKDLAARFEPSGYFGEQVGVPLHVLEHFDRKHVCESEQRTIDSSIQQISTFDAIVPDLLLLLLEIKLREVASDHLEDIDVHCQSPVTVPWPRVCSSLRHFQSPFPCRSRRYEPFGSASWTAS